VDKIFIYKIRTANEAKKIMLFALLYYVQFEKDIIG